MRITLTEAEIKTAITNHIESAGFSLTNKTVDIDLKATRGSEGYTADIDIMGDQDTASRPMPRSEATPQNSFKGEEVTDEVEEDEADSPEEAETEATEPVSSKSIFANMTKPNNKAA